MKLKLTIIIVSFLICLTAQAQFKTERITFVDTTTSTLFEIPNWATLAGIAKPDSGGGEVITFETEVHEDSTTRYTVLTEKADSTYTITLSDSTKDYYLPLDTKIFDNLRYLRVKFAKKTNVSLWLFYRKRN